ncbi:OpgC domain-containing protein [Filomicrobium sp.]|nr:OpgC domain-containing protein [Filomicrobium sp.]
MFAIYIGHVPMNAWSDFMPGRFGFADAAEVFVFCSGIASALAFGRSYDQHGFSIGTARVAYRCWQVYWAHIGIFFVALAAMMMVDKWLGAGADYVIGLNLARFVNDLSTNLPGLLTLTYVPNMFDILPMYLVLLAMIPVVIALSKLGPVYVFSAMVLSWTAANLNWIELSAEPWSDREWFFNPFAWQLVFFTGFAFARGWLPVPPVNRRLMTIAAVVVLLTIPLAYWPLVRNVDVLKAAAKALSPLTDKTHASALRYVHFLCVAYLAYALAGDRGANLRGRFVAICQLVGQQALATFMVGLLLSLLSGVALNLIGRNFATYALVNLSGCAILLATAYVVAWFKNVQGRKAVRAVSIPTANVAQHLPQTAPPLSRPLVQPVE